jgi:hypothetical protein
MEQNEDYIEQHSTGANSVALENSDEGSLPDARRKFHIDCSKIKSVPISEQNAELQNLNLQVYNQDTFEQG